MIDRQHVRQIALLVIVALCLVLCWYLVQPFFGPLMAAGALAVLFSPAYSALRSRLRGRENIATLLTLLLAFLLILLPSAWVVWMLSQEAAHAYNAVKNKTEADGGILEWCIQNAGPKLASLGIDSLSSEEQLRAALAERIEAISTGTLRLARGLVSNVAVFLFHTILAFFMLFFLLRDGNHLLAKAREFLPIEEAIFDRLIREVGQSVLANVYGIGAVALSQGVATGILFAAVGIHSPVFWGVIAGFASMIPILGPPIVWLPAAVGLAITGHWIKAVIVAAVGGGVIGLMDNIIRPWIISGKVELHPLLVFISLLGGVQAFGFLGLFIGPAILSVTVVLLEVLKYGIPGSVLVRESTVKES